MGSAKTIGKELNEEYKIIDITNDINKLWYENNK